MLTQITVDTGTANPHIFAISDAIIHNAIFGTDFVGEEMSNFQPTVMSNNEIRIGSGLVCIGGHIGCIPHGSYESCSIATGNIGYQRKDLIVARYSRASGIDFMGLHVYKGVPSKTNPILPAYKSDNILQAEGIREVPLYSVLVYELNISLVERITIPKSSYKSLPTSTKTPSGFSQVVRDIITVQKRESFTATFVQDSVNGIWSCAKTMDIELPNEQKYDIPSYKSFYNGSVESLEPLFFHPTSIVVPPDDNIITVSYKLCSKVSIPPASVSVTVSARMFTFVE